MRKTGRENIEIKTRGGAKETADNIHHFLIFTVEAF